MDPLQFAYRSNRSPDDAIAFITFTFMHLAEAFIQSNLQDIHFFTLCVFPGNRTDNLLRSKRNALPLSHRNTQAFNLHTALSHLENKNTYVKMLFVDYSSAFNTIVPATLVVKLQTLGLNRSLCSWILDFLTGRSQVVRKGNNTSSPLVLNWCSSGLCPQPTPVLPVHI